MVAWWKWVWKGFFWIIVWDKKSSSHAFMWQCCTEQFAVCDLILAAKLPLQECCNKKRNTWTTSKLCFGLPVYVWLRPPSQSQTQNRNQYIRYEANCFGCVSTTWQHRNNRRPKRQDFSVPNVPPTKAVVWRETNILKFGMCSSHSGSCVSVQRNWHKEHKQDLVSVVSSNLKACQFYILGRSILSYPDSSDSNSTTLDARLLLSQCSQKDICHLNLVSQQKSQKRVRALSTEPHLSSQKIKQRVVSSLVWNLCWASVWINCQKWWLMDFSEERFGVYILRTRIHTQTSWHFPCPH